MVNALLAGLKELLNDQAFGPERIEGLTDKLAKISDDFGEQLGELNCTVDEAFFTQPKLLLQQANMIEAVGQWFEQIGYSAASARALAVRFEASFPFALQQQWRDNQTIYQPIFDSFNTPFTSATQLEQKQAFYNQFLVKQAYESVFGDNIGWVYPLY